MSSTASTVSVLNSPDGTSSEETAAEILTAMEQQGGWSGEIHNIKKDGTRFWTHAEVSTFEHPEIDGKVWVSVQRDVTEQKLGEESDQRLRALVEQASDAIVAATNEGIVTSWNPGAERLYGYTAEEMVGQSISRIIPDHRADEFDHALASVHEEESYRLETERRRKDGSVVWVSLSVSPVKDRDGKVLGCSAIYSDVSERRRAEEELRKSEAQLADAQRVAHIGSWEWDIARNEIHWSDELYRIHGVEPDEFEASYEAFIEGVHPDDREFVDGVVKKAFADGEPFDYYHRCLRPDGEIRMLHAQGRVERDEAGRPIRMLGICQDVTELKRMEAPQRHLAAIVESSEDAIFSKSRDGIITSWNPGAVHLFGYEPQDIVGRPMHVLVPPERESEEQEIMESVLAGDERPQLRDAATAEGRHAGRRVGDRLADQGRTMERSSGRRRSPATSPSHWGACTASVCSTASGAFACTSSATSASGCTMPVSLFTSITETTAVRVSSADGERVEIDRPSGRAATVATRNPSAASRRSRAEHGLVLDAGRHDAVERRRRARGPCAAPFTARLSASLPLPVNTTSPGSAPHASATTSRAVSSAVFVTRDAPWLPEGFPGDSARNGSIAVIASGRIGVDAA